MRAGASRRLTIEFWSKSYVESLLSYAFIFNHHSETFKRRLTHQTVRLQPRSISNLRPRQPPIRMSFPCLHGPDQVHQMAERARYPAYHPLCSSCAPGTQPVAPTPAATLPANDLASGLSGELKVVTEEGHGAAHESSCPISLGWRLAATYGSSPSDQRVNNQHLARPCKSRIGSGYDLYHDAWKSSPAKHGYCVAYRPASYRYPSSEI